MKKIWSCTVALFFITFIYCISIILSPNFYSIASEGTIKLPQPKFDGTVSVEKALKERRSIRSYKNEPLTIEMVSQLLWAAQGITEPSRGLRTAPSARAQYLLEVYLIAGNVVGIEPGMYKYKPHTHEMVLVKKGDIKGLIYNTVGQTPLKNAPAVFVFTGYYKRSSNPAWMLLEAGHAAQNVYLQAVPLQLGTVVMAGFKPEEVKRALMLPDDEQPIYIMPFGRP